MKNIKSSFQAQERKNSFIFGVTPEEICENSMEYDISSKDDGKKNNDFIEDYEDQLFHMQSSK